MSTALLKFQPPNPAPKEYGLDPRILAGAVDASREPMAVSENGNLIYTNRSFAQLSARLAEGKHDSQGPMAVLSDSGWRTMEFSFAGRSFS